jgi:hypothetical protein
MKKYKACLTRCKTQTQSVLLFFTYKGDAYQICMLECQIEKLQTKLTLMRNNKKILASITDPRKRQE